MQGEEGAEVNASTPIVEGWFENIGATVMARNMFGGGPDSWEADPWKGYWGRTRQTTTRSSCSPIMTGSPWRGHPARVEESREPGAPDRDLVATDGLLPGT